MPPRHAAARLLKGVLMSQVRVSERRGVRVCGRRGSCPALHCRARIVDPPVLRFFQLLRRPPRAPPTPPPPSTVPQPGSPSTLAHRTGDLAGWWRGGGCQNAVPLGRDPGHLPKHKRIHTSYHHHHPTPPRPPPSFPRPPPTLLRHPGRRPGSPGPDLPGCHPLHPHLWLVGFLPCRRRGQRPPHPLTRHPERRRPDGVCPRRGRHQRRRARGRPGRLRRGRRPGRRTLGRRAFLWRRRPVARPPAPALPGL